METYGLHFKITPHTVSLIIDTKCLPELPDLYHGEALVIHVVRLKPIGDEPIEPLSVKDVKTIVKKTKPKLTIPTHLGMAMIKAKPWIVVAELEKELGLKVIPARDVLQLMIDLKKLG